MFNDNVVTTWTSDCLKTEKHHQSQHSLPSLWTINTVNRVPAYLSEVKPGCVHLWQITLRDPIWQMTLHCCSMSFPQNALGLGLHILLSYMEVPLYVR